MGGFFTRWRWGLFVGGTAFGLYFWFAGVKNDPAQAFLNGLIIMTISFTLVATNVAELIASPLTNFIDSIYLPGGNWGKAPLKYELPIYYERHFRGEDAAVAYEAIIKSHPNQIHAYGGVIRVCKTQLCDRARAKHWKAQAERRFGREKVAASVAKTAEEWHAELFKSALAPAPSQ